MLSISYNDHYFRKRHEDLDDLLAQHAYRSTKRHVYKYALGVQRVKIAHFRNIEIYYILYLVEERQTL